MGLIRLLMYGGLLWLLYRLVKGLLGRSGGPAASGTQRQARPAGSLDGGELVQDPSCGVYIPKASAFAGPDGRFFCSEKCRDAYGRKPEP